MDERAAKLALARKKLKDHQEKKSVAEKENVFDKEQSTIHNNDAINPTTVTQVTGCKKENGDEIKYEGIPESDYLKNNRTSQNLHSVDENVTEFLISDKRTLEVQISELQSKLSQLEYLYSLEINNHNISKHKLCNVENELKNIYNKYLVATEDALSKDKVINELNTIKTSLSDENNNLLEQVEFTKTVLTAKEAENASLHSQLCNLQNQLDVTQLQLQQITNGSCTYISHDNKDLEQNEALLQKISNLEQQLKLLQKERDQMNLHYEHYISELNEQLKSAVNKNGELLKEIQDLSNRENSLVEQISDMEIRLQNYNIKKEETNVQNIQTNIDVTKLEHSYEAVQEKLKELSIKYDELQTLYMESEAKVKELSEIKGVESNHDNISLIKLNADITSDKVAAQRATEQNKKLKRDIQELEEAFVKMSQDKLELTEKLTAEKYLNRELTIKLAEIEENAKDFRIKLMAKDEEMIRLQTSYRQAEKTITETSQDIILPDNVSKSTDSVKKDENLDCKQTINKLYMELENYTKHDSKTNDCIHKSLIKASDENNRFSIPKEDAMVKLQERFLKIMEEVADLSDEKHRLEHIILQLQNETDTICEYVALYQQQRSLLKKRDEERSAQIKIFQVECDRLKRQIEELSRILVRFAEDKQLSAYFKIESKHNDLAKVMDLLSNLKHNSLIDPRKKSLELKDFYPCNCCSGQLIDI